MSEQAKGFFNNLLANATWEFGKKVVGGSLVPATITAIWGKLSHGSLDWFAIGIMFATTFVMLALIFRKSRSYAGVSVEKVTTAQPSQPNGAIIPGIPTLSSLLGQTPNVTFDPKIFFATAHYSPITAQVEENIKIVARRYSPADPEAFYARFIGIGWVSYANDETWYTIYGSQLRALEELNRNGISPLSVVKAHYEEAVPKFPSLYPKYTFEKWFAYLKNRSLIATYPSDMVEISFYGKEFLKYLTHKGWPIHGKTF